MKSLFTLTTGLLLASAALANFSYADLLSAENTLVITAAADNTNFTLTTTTTTVSETLDFGQSFTYNPVLKDSNFVIQASKAVQALQINNAGAFTYLSSFPTSNFFSAFFPAHQTSDLNVVAYSSTTQVTVIRIEDHTTVAAFTMVPGEDLLTSGKGIGLLEAGYTYLIQTNVPASVQAGTLAGAVGTTLSTTLTTTTVQVQTPAGEFAADTLYFTIPTTENQELRVTSLDPENTAVLARYVDGYWIELAGWQLDLNETDEWIGAHYLQQYDNVFRITCKPGKKVSVLTSNGSLDGTTGNMDRFYAATAQNGQAAGENFSLTLAAASSIYIKGNATVRLYDEASKGNAFDTTITVAGFYTLNIDLNTYHTLFNGDGQTLSGMQRPAINIEASATVNVWNGNTTPNMSVAKATTVTSTATLVDHELNLLTLNPINHDLMIYPNPVQTQATVSIYNANNENTMITKATIYNMNGQVINTINVNQENTFTLYRNNMQAGTYLIALETEKGSHFTSSLIIAE